MPRRAPSSSIPAKGSAKGHPRSHQRDDMLEALGTAEPRLGGSTSSPPRGYSKVDPIRRILRIRRIPSGGAFEAAHSDRVPIAQFAESIMGSWPDGFGTPA